MLATPTPFGWSFPLVSLVCTCGLEKKTGAQIGLAQNGLTQKLCEPNILSGRQPLELPTEVLSGLFVQFLLNVLRKEKYNPEYYLSLSLSPSLPLSFPLSFPFSPPSLLSLPPPPSLIYYSLLLPIIKSRLLSGNITEVKGNFTLLTIYLFILQCSGITSGETQGTVQGMWDRTQVGLHTRQLPYLLYDCSSIVLSASLFSLNMCLIQI